LGGAVWSARLGATLYVPAVDGVGPSSVTWVLDERGVVGDNILDRVTPVVWERGRLSV